MDGYVFVPYWLFVLLIALAVLALEHVLVDAVRGTMKLMDWWERRRRSAAAPPPASSAIVTLDEYRAEKLRLEDRQKERP